MKPIIIVAYISDRMFDIFDGSGFKTKAGSNLFVVTAKGDRLNTVEREITDLLLTAYDQFKDRHPDMDPSELKAVVNYGYAEADPKFYEDLKIL